MVYNGMYHLMYQYNPTAAVWGDMHWGHAYSPNLVQWGSLPPALLPDQPYDEGGVFSGSVTLVPHAGAPQGLLPVAAYTCVDAAGHQRQCLASPRNASDPLLRSWVKPAYNPILESPPPGGSLTLFRDDSTAWRNTPEGPWNMAVGVATNGEGSIAVYTAKKFLAHDWTLAGTLAKFHPAAEWANMYECPDFFPVPGAAPGQGGVDCSGTPGGDSRTWVAKISALPGRRDYAALGCYDSLRNAFLQVGPLTLYDAGVWYASKTFLDSAAAPPRQVLWGWVTETDAQSNWVDRGWAGLQGLPRVVGVHPTLPILTTSPLPQLHSLLTGSPQSYVGQVQPGTPVQVGNLPQAQGQLQLKLQPPHASPGLGSLQETVMAARNASQSVLLRFPSTATAAVVITAYGGNGAAHPGAAFQGGDFLNVPLPSGGNASAAAAACAALCAGEYAAACIAWTATQDTCSLKGWVPDVTHDPAATSGLRSGLTVTLDTAGMGATTPSTTIGGAFTQPLPLLDMTIWLDRSVVEVFAAEGTIRLTQRVYPGVPGLQVDLAAAPAADAFQAAADLQAADTIWSLSPPLQEAA